MAYSYRASANPTTQQQGFQARPDMRQQSASPAQQQPAPSKAPDMSAYAQPAGGFNAYNVPRTPPQGARQNDLSGQVPSNQIWAQAYNQASNQYGGNTQAQSWTMPGSYTSRSYNPTTGQYSQPTGGQSWNGNMAYNAIDQRPSPIQASATGVGGNPMQWQDAMRQQSAYVGNLSERLNQYSGGQLTGPVTFDSSRLLSQADEQLAKGTFQNPFNAQPTGLRAPGPESPKAGYETKPPSQWSDEDWAGYKNEQESGPRRYLVHKPSYYRDEQGRAQYSSGGHSAEAPVDADAAWQRERTESVSRLPANQSQPPDVQRAMDSATQYMQGNFQNPFGNSPAANNPRPSWDQQSYDPRPTATPGPFDWMNNPEAMRPRVSGQPGRRVAFVGGDMGVSEAHVGTEEFDRILNQEQAKYGSTSSVGDAFGPERQAPPPVRTAPGSAQPIAPQSQGTPYDPAPVWTRQADGSFERQYDPLTLMSSAMKWSPPGSPADTLSQNQIRAFKSKLGEPKSDAESWSPSPGAVTPEGAMELGKRQYEWAMKHPANPTAQKILADGQPMGVEGHQPAQRPGAAQPIAPQSQGTPYNPQATRESLPAVPPAPAQKTANQLLAESWEKDPSLRPKADPKLLAEYYAKYPKLREAQEAANAKIAAGPVQKTQDELRAELYRVQPHLAPKPDYTNMVPGIDYDLVTGEIKTKATKEELLAARWREREEQAVNSWYDTGKATPAIIAQVRRDYQEMRREAGVGPTGGQQSAPASNDSARTAQLAKIDNEIRKWQAATYGTWQGSGPPAEWRSHIQALQRLRGKAVAGDPAALAWNPKMQAPPAHVHASPGKGSSDRVYRNGPGGFQWRQRPGS